MWSYYCMSKNPNLTTEIIEKYIDKEWSWEHISLCSNITMEFVEKYYDKFNREELLKNSCIIMRLKNIEIYIFRYI